VGEAPAVKEYTNLFKPAPYINAASKILSLSFDIGSVKAMLTQTSWVFKCHEHYTTHRKVITGKGKNYVVRQLNVDNIKQLKDDSDAISMQKALATVKNDPTSNIIFRTEADSEPLTVPPTVPPPEDNPKDNPPIVTAGL
jgi:hypothetical protein